MHGLWLVHAHAGVVTHTPALSFLPIYLPTCMLGHSGV